MRLSILLVLSMSLVAAAPTTRDYEKEAREFFGKALNLVKQEKYGEVFDLVAAKGEGLVPGFFKEEQIKELRSLAIVIGERNEQNDPSSRFKKLFDEVQEQSQSYMQEKLKLLSDEARTYFIEGLTKFFTTEIEDKLREFTPDVIEFRKKFDALSAPAKDSLIKAYPIYGRLEEIQAHVKVFDSIIRNLKGLCTELSGFEECKQFLKMRLTLFLLLLVGVVASAPVPGDYEKEARQFFGKAANLLKRENLGEAIDLLAEKVESLVPGFIKDEWLKEFRSFITEWTDGKEKTDQVLANQMSKYRKLFAELAMDINLYRQEKSQLLTIEARAFFEKCFKKDFYPEIEDNAHEWTPIVIAFGKKFDALSTPAKYSLIKAIPFFGRLDEVKAHAKVFDAIYLSMKGLCAELPGFDVCERLRKHF